MLMYYVFYLFSKKISNKKSIMNELIQFQHYQRFVCLTYAPLMSLSNVTVD